MPFTKYNLQGLTSMRSAATQIGISSYSRFWHMVREAHTIQAPSTTVGRREYYTEKDMSSLLAQVAELRQEGVIK